MGVTRPKMLNERKPSLADKVLSAVLTAVLVLLVAFTIFNLWFVQNYFVVQVDGISMNDTLADKDLLYTQKRNFEAQRGDIVIIDVEPYRGLFSRNVEHIIKRLIAVEGDCVKCEQGTVYVKAGEGEYAAFRTVRQGRYRRFPRISGWQGRDFLPRRQSRGQ